MEFPDDKPELLGRLLMILYCGFYPQQLSGNQGHDCHNELNNAFGQLKFVDCFSSVGDDFELELNLHASMYAMGDKYLVEELKEFSLRKFCQSWSRYCTRIDAAQKCSHGSHHSAVITQSLAESVYRKTPEIDRGLKDLLLTYLLRDYFDTAQDSIAMAPYKGLLLAVPDLAYDMLTHWLRETEATCTTCGSKDISILERHCSCVDQDEHTIGCNTDNKMRRRCTQCGNQGCLEFAYS